MMSSLSNMLFSKQILRFLISGGIAALVNFCSRFFFQLFFTYTLSIALSFSLGSVISFLLNKNFTFRSYDEKTAVQLVKFMLATVFGVILATFIVFIQITLFGFLGITFITEKEMELIVHIITIGIITIYSYLVMKYFAFKRFSRTEKE